VLSRLRENAADLDEPRQAISRPMGGWCEPARSDSVTRPKEGDCHLWGVLIVNAV
jgi:hypothetical protein